MFITRKVYGAGAAGYVGYVVADKYGHETQLTPIEAQELHQWLHDHAAQIHADVHGIASSSADDELAARWKQPKTTTVYLLNGSVIETEINGKTLDGSSGYILINSKDVNVDLIDGRWQESKRGKGWK